MIFEWSRVEPEEGRFDEALPYAEKLKTVPDVERFSRLALAVDSFRTKNYPAAQNWLKLALESDLDKLISEETGLHVQVADDPLTCVARGGGRALELLDMHGNEFFSN